MVHRWDKKWYTGTMTPSRNKQTNTNNQTQTNKQTNKQKCISSASDLFSCFVPKPGSNLYSAFFLQALLCLPCWAKLPGGGRGAGAQSGSTLTDMGLYKVTTSGIPSHPQMDVSSFAGQLHKVLPEKPEGLVQVISSPFTIWAETPPGEDMAIFKKRLCRSLWQEGVETPQPAEADYPVMAQFFSRHQPGS